MKVRHMRNERIPDGDNWLVESENSPAQGKPVGIVAMPTTAGETLIETGKASLRLGQYDKALMIYTEAMNLIPDNPEVYHGMGWVYFAKKEWQKARSYAQQAVKLAPAVARYHLAAAACAQKCRDLESVLTHLESAYRIDPLLFDKRTRWVLAYSKIFAGLEKLGLLIVWGFLATIWVHAVPSDNMWQWVLVGALPFVMVSGWYFRQRLCRRAAWSLLLCIAWVIVVYWLA